MAINGIYFGQELTQTSKLENSVANEIYASLIASMLFIIILGNMVVGDSAAIMSSVATGAACIAIVIAWYGLWILLSRIIWSLLIILISLAAAAYDSSGIGISFVYFLMGLGALLAIKNLRISRSFFGTVLLIGVLAAFVAIGVDGAYTSFDLVRQVQLGLVNKDTLFHASIAGMIKNYGVASTGLNGLVDINYHTFSHSIMAAISKLSQQSVLETYAVAQAVLFIPLMMFSIVFCTVSLTDKKNVNIPVIFTVLSLLLAVLPSILVKWGFWNSYLVSESFTLAISIFCLGIVVLYKQKLGHLDIFLVVVLTALMAITKVSVAAIYCGLWGLRYLFLIKGWANVDLLASGLSLLVFLASSYSLKGNSINLFDFQFLHFVEKFSMLGKYLSEVTLVKGPMSFSSIILNSLAILAFFNFIALHFFPAWVSIVLCKYGGTWRQALKKPAVIYGLGSILAGVIFVNFAFPGGAAYYFSMVSFFVALPIMLAAVSGWFCTQYAKHDVIQSGRWILALAAFIFVEVNIEVFYLHAKNSLPETSNPLIQSLKNIKINSEKAQIIAANNDLHKGNPLQDCSARPFIFPAVSERPWIGVIDPHGDCRYQWYGYEGYNVGPDKSRVLPAPILEGLPIVSVESIRWAEVTKKW
jgi:hypothetical protein